MLPDPPVIFQVEGRYAESPDAFRSQRVDRRVHPSGAHSGRSGSSFRHSQARSRVVLGLGLEGGARCSSCILILFWFSPITSLFFTIFIYAGLGPSGIDGRFLIFRTSGLLSCRTGQALRRDSLG